jgi:ribosomal protein L29
MKKNELRDLLKSGKKAAMAKVAELKLAIVDSKLKSSRGEEKNTAARKNMKRTIARLLTHVSLMKEAK